ncbi:cupin domain-containing protein [Actinocrispum wychmicini]|uniref:Cupin domain n=1 Tax=Actinocrispum wychmicini TaxID=1213861 RepID=A0A4R2J608_9PSEU|nr:cupin domain-containing protein [Actinocrispum wychmicini]TCO53427.1 cupin domain [Actinocrispum wychmicini]
MSLSTRADAPRFESDAYTFYPLAVPSRGSKELAIWHLDAGAGATSPPHQHDREVVFVVKTGRMAATIGEEELAAGPGDAFIVPSHTMFALRNASAVEPATLTVITTVGMRAIMDGNSFPPPWSL